MSTFIERLRSKSRTGINASYKIINDFESSSEKECAKMDKDNEKIYSRLLTQAEKAHHAIRNSGLSMNLEVPIPPRPSNRDRFLLWKRRNVSKKVIEQTESVLFLQSKGYKYNEHYEAYQAIDLANEIRKTSGYPVEFKDSSKNFENVYNKNDKNIFRRRSMYKLRENETRMITDTRSNLYDQEDLSTFSAPLLNQPQPLSQPQIQNASTHENNIVLNTIISENTLNSIAPSAPSAPAPSYNELEVHQRETRNTTNFLNQNYSQIAKQNRNLNSVKPSAPPASTCQVNHQNLKRNTSSPCIGFGLEC